jgi:signal transduction histidine kinase
MAYLGTLAAGLAHEIRNPLNSLNLNMQLIEEEMQHLSRGATPRLLTITRDEIGRLERLVTDFLAYARPRAPERGVVDLTELLERVRDQVAAEAREAGATIVVEADEELALVADRSQLQQLLLNVVRNACSAVAAGGKPGTVTLAVAREGQFVRLDVVDTGVGIPAEAMPHIFEVFWSTKKGGTGLGLAIADRIARAHGGEVQVTSTVGEGTRVRLLLPFDTTHSAPVKAS